LKVFIDVVFNEVQRISSTFKLILYASLRCMLCKSFS